MEKKPPKIKDFKHSVISIKYRKTNSTNPEYCEIFNAFLLIHFTDKSQINPKIPFATKIKSFV